MTPRPTQILALNLVLAAAFSATALAQKVEIGNLAYEKNPPYPEAQNPQLPLQVYDPEFAEILGKEPKLVHLANGFGFTEGPVYLQVKNSDAGYLIFTDQINDNINLIRWHASG